MLTYPDLDYSTPYNKARLSLNSIEARIRHLADKRKYRRIYHQISAYENVNVFMSVDGHSLIRLVTNSEKMFFSIFTELPELHDQLMSDKDIISYKLDLDEYEKDLLVKTLKGSPADRS